MLKIRKNKSYVQKKADDKFDFSTQESLLKYSSLNILQAFGFFSLVGKGL